MSHLLQLSLVAIFAFSSSSHIVTGEDTESALIIVDVQECFLPGGSLAVANGDKIIPVINSIREKNNFKVVAFSKDWHPQGHVSFASAHNKSVGDVITLQYSSTGELFLGGTVTKARFPNAINPSGQPKVIQQKLWPDHCIQNVSSGPTSSHLGPGLKQEKNDIIIYKGTHKQIDSYSAFNDNGGFFSTHLDQELKARKVNKVFVSGFALDVCVYYTSLDARKLGYETYIVLDASLGIDYNSIEQAKRIMTAEGVHLITHNQIAEALTGQSNLFEPCLTLILIACAMSRTVMINWLFFF